MSAMKANVSFLVISITVIALSPLHTNTLRQAPQHSVYSQTAEPIISSVAWSPDGTRIAAGYSQGVVKIWDAATMSLQTSVQTGLEGWDVSAFSVNTLSWSPDGHLLAAGLDTLPPGGFIQVIDVDTGQILESLYAGYRIPSLAWSPDGSMLAAGLTILSPLLTPKGWIRVWDSAEFQLIAEFEHGYASDVAEIAWSPDGSKLASAGYDEAGFDNSVRTWDTTQWTLLQTFEHPGLVMSVAWGPDGTRLASSGVGVPGRIWDSATGQQLIDLQTGDPEEMFAGASYIAWRPYSSQVVSHAVGRIILWDSATGQVIEEQPLWTHSLNLAWSPDGSLLTYPHDYQITTIAPPLTPPTTPTPAYTPTAMSPR
jgi:WD40 repeat protein